MNMYQFACSDTMKIENLDLKSFFPVKSKQTVAEIFLSELKKSEPNLAALSIIIGAVENTLTDAKKVAPLEEEIFPVQEWDSFELMYRNYMTDICDKLIPAMTTSESPEFSSREQIKSIADFVWSNLSRAFFKDKFHIQTIYSFLTGKRLDCFGLAYTVVAIAQTLGMKDVHLALSEDHAWVTFEENGTNTAEITWNGKGNEEKRAKPIDFGGTVDVEKNWLYLGRHEMKCNRHMEVAALVSAINPGINTKMDSETVGSLQQV